MKVTLCLQKTKKSPSASLALRLPTCPRAQHVRLAAKAANVAVRRALKEREVGAAVAVFQPQKCNHGEDDQLPACAR